MKDSQMLLCTQQFHKARRLKERLYLPTYVRSILSFRVFMYTHMQCKYLHIDIFTFTLKYLDIFVHYM